LRTDPTAVVSPASRVERSAPGNDGKPRDAPAGPKGVRGERASVFATKMLAALRE